MGEAFVDLTSWNTDLVRVINQGSGSLVRMIMFGVIAAILAAAGFSMLGSYLAGKGPQALDHAHVSKKGHYIWLFVIALLALVRDYYTSPIGIVLTVLTIGLALVSILLLATWHKEGVLASVAFSWVALIGGEIPLMLLFLKDFQQLENYDLPNQYAIYAAARYTGTRMIAQAVLAMILTVIIIVYYGRRKMLFRGEQKQLKMANACPKCGRVITSDYCPECGRDLREFKSSKLSFQVLNQNQFCPDCGFELEEDGFCPRCESRRHPVPELTEEQTILLKKQEHKTHEKLRSSISDPVKKILAFVIICVLMFTPMLASDPMTRISKASAHIYNPVVESIQEYEANPAVAKDETWLADFDQRCEALYEKNASGFYGGSLERLDYAELYQFIQYFPQAYYQNSTVDYIQKTYHGELNGDLSTLYDKLDQINNEQIQILMSSMSIIGYGNQGIFGTAISVLRIFGDTMRGYISFVGVNAFIIILGALGLIALLTSAVLFLKKGAWSPFETLASGGVDPKTAEEEGTKYKKQSKKDRILTGLGTVAFLVFCIAVGTLFQNQEEVPSYNTCMETCYYDDGAKMMEWLSSVKTDPSQALAEKQKFLDAYADWKTNLAIAQSADNLEEYEKYPEVKELTEKLNQSFEEVKNNLIEGELPEDQAVTEMVGDMTKGMALMQQYVLMDLYEGVDGLID